MENYKEIFSTKLYPTEQSRLGLGLDPKAPSTQHAHSEPSVSKKEQTPKDIAIGNVEAINKLYAAAKPDVQKEVMKVLRAFQKDHDSPEKQQAVNTALEYLKTPEEMLNKTMRLIRELQAKATLLNKDTIKQAQQAIGSIQSKGGATLQNMIKLHNLATRLGISVVPQAKPEQALATPIPPSVAPRSPSASSDGNIPYNPTHSGDGRLSSVGSTDSSRRGSFS